MAKTAQARITAERLQEVQRIYQETTGRTAQLVLSEPQKVEEERLWKGRHADTARVKLELTEQTVEKQSEQRKFKKQAQLANAEERKRKIKAFRELLELDEEEDAAAAQRLKQIPPTDTDEATQDHRFVIIPPRNNKSSQNVQPVAFKLKDPKMLAEVLKIYMEIMGHLPKTLPIHFEDIASIFTAPSALFSIPGVTTPTLTPRPKASSAVDEETNALQTTQNQRFEFTFDTVEQYQRFVQAISPYVNFSRAPELKPGEPIKLHLDVEDAPAPSI